jgi:ATP-binding cassette, subfamily B, bacterial MsbA
MSNLSLYRRMIRYALVYWPLFAITVALSILCVNFEAISVWFGASVIKTIFIPDNTAVAPVPFSIGNLNELLKYWTARLVQRPEKIDTLKMVCMIMALAFVLKNIAIYLKSIVIAKANLKVVRDIRNELFSHELMLPVGHFDRERSGNIISLVVNDVASFNDSMASTFDKIFTEPLKVVAYIGLLFVINAKLAIVVFVIFPVIGILISIIGKAVRRRSRRILESLGGLLSILHETVGGIRAVKMFNMNDYESKRFQKENEKFTHHSFRATQIGSVSSPLTEVLGVAAAIVLLWFGGAQVLQGKGFGAEDFVRFLLLLFVTYSPIKNLTGIYNTLQRGFAAAERVFAMLDTPREELRPVTPDSVPRFNEEISFSKVNFTYPGCAEQVLYDINFSLKKGRIVALVGSSGSGKSTMLDLLPRFYPLSSGSIRIDGNDINAMDLAGLRSLFGIVAQETVLFNDTVGNNIAYGLTDATRERIKSAAKAAHAWEFIEKMPNGLDTVIGERGVMLSGGQRQRLAIARALLRNPPILILDEATSALDTESERLVQQAINRLVENRTVLVVAHRLSTIQHADLILVLDQGRIIERGSHAELLALGKKYKHLHDIQFGAAGK